MLNQLEVSSLMVCTSRFQHWLVRCEDQKPLGTARKTESRTRSLLLLTELTERMGLQPSGTAVVFRLSPAAPALGRSRPCRVG